MRTCSSLVDSALDLTGLIGHRQVTDLHLLNLAARSGARLTTFDQRIAGALIPADRRHLRVL